jgi:hypothetical protein
MVAVSIDQHIFEVNELCITFSILLKDYLLSIINAISNNILGKLFLIALFFIKYFLLIFTLYFI